MRKICLLLSFCFVAIIANAQVLTLREQARVTNEILNNRLNNLLPELMDKYKVEMWIIVSREYNEDPVLKTMLPAEWLNARRTTILVFYRNAAKNIFEKLAVARYNVGDSIKAAWDMVRFPNQWDALTDIISTHKPANIALNTSKNFAHADGIDHTDYLELLQHVPDAYKNKIISAELLAVAWLETRTPREMQLYPQLISITHKVIEEGFSDKVITPGITTTEDLVWWFRQKLNDLGLGTWFHPSVSIQRNDSVIFNHVTSFSKRADEETVQPGDLLHVDFGITYLRLNTDIQEHAYILRPGEKEAPADIKKAFAAANRLQDILTAQFKENKTGNEILAAALKHAKAEGIIPSIYTHPLGYHGHAAGPTIGMWDMQNGVPGSGDFPMHLNTAYSIELNASTSIPGWKKQIRIMLEEDGFFGEDGFRFINGRQKEIYLVPRAMGNLE